MSLVHRTFLKTPVGYLELSGTSSGIRSLTFLDFRVRIPKVPADLKQTVGQLEAYFKGSLHEFNVKLDLQGTPFQLKVWNELLNIPYGKTISYVELAGRTGNINAFRAVGRANSCNPVSIIIPCHRVIGYDGRLVGYRGGLKKKKWLLEHEHAFAQRDLFYGKM